MKKDQSILYLILIFITIIDILLLFYVAVYHVSLETRYEVFTFDLIICIILWIEFIYSMPKNNKKQYVKDNALSILGMLPIDFIFLRALRLIKLIQMIKSFSIQMFNEKAVTKFLKETLLDEIILFAILFIFLMTALIRIFDSNINDMDTALWYIMVTLTSTGYGDIVPGTISGRIIGTITMIGGILIFATITAVISSRYIARINKDHRDELELKIEGLTSEIEKLNKKIDEMKKD